MSDAFRTEFIAEPKLVFGERQEEDDPKTGLARYGPYQYEDEEFTLERVPIGIVGNRIGISLAQDIIAILQKPLPSYHYDNRWLFPEYIGMNKDSSFRCGISAPQIWHEKISDDFELAKIKEMPDSNKRIFYTSNLYADKVRKIAANDDKPAVVICVLSEHVEKYCGISDLTRNAKIARATDVEIQTHRMKEKGQTFWDDWGIEAVNDTEKSYDFRNALKGKVMQYNIPIQILHETTCKHALQYDSRDKHEMQDPCSFAWNLSTALFYKANGKPWRLAKLPNDTCYVGVSFFRNKLHPVDNIQTSMAQIFTHTGEGLVLRGEDVRVDERTREPHLTREQAEQLLTRAISKYKEKSGQTPGRIVVHKTTSFTDMEKQGFNLAITKSPTFRKDFVTVKIPHDGIVFLRAGRFPTLRGTIICLEPNRFLLYASGFTPRIRTYPGHRIPRPLDIRHEGDSTPQELAREILGLTKLNWNTASFSTNLPITIKFAKEVGKILSEYPADRPLQDHYRFFM